MRTEITFIRLNSHLNIMKRELIDFSETWDINTTPQRLDDLRALLASNQPRQNETGRCY